MAHLSYVSLTVLLSEEGLVGRDALDHSCAFPRLVASTRTASLRLPELSRCPLGRHPGSHRDVPLCPASKGHRFRGFTAASPMAMHHPRMVLPVQPLAATQALHTAGGTRGLWSEGREVV